MSGFHEIRLPLVLAFGAAGGPVLASSVVRLASGRESRNARWTSARRQWQLGGLKLRTDQAQELSAFFEARGGRVFGFRFRDPVDWMSCAPSGGIAAADQALGIGDGTTTSFQLTKHYSSGEASFARVIAKPVDGSVVVAVDGEAASGFDVDWTTGVVTFEAAPAEGAVLTAGFEFDVPARFDADKIEFAVEAPGVLRVTHAAVVEIAG